MEEVEEIGQMQEGGAGVGDMWRGLMKEAHVGEKVEEQ